MITSIESKNTVIIGDTHARFPDLNRQIVKYDYPDVILQVGDFGWWPHMHSLSGFIGKTTLFDQYGIRNKETKIFWCDGNHENHDDLKRLVDEHGRIPIEVMPNVFFCPRGSHIEINGQTIMFFGGATSIDKHMRVPGHSWWAGENITEDDLDSIPDIKVDIIISHAAPKYFKINKWIDSDNDYNRLALNIVYDRCRPKRWFFGHYHEYKTEIYDRCKWTCLSNIEGKEPFACEL